MSEPYTVSAGPRIRLLPVVHDRVELGAVVRRALEALDPAVVAVELPPTVADPARRAADRLPEISLLVSEEPGEEALVWAVTPGDPLAEGLRWAGERGRPRVFVDPDIPYAERHRDPIPDPWAIWEIGPDRYLELLVEAASDWPFSEADRRRERGMAHAIAEASRSADGLVVALIGAAHVGRVAEDLDRPQATPFARTRRTSVSLHHLHPESLTALLPDPPLAHAAWEHLREGGPEERVPFESVVSRPVSLVGHGLRLVSRDAGPSEAERKRRLAAHAAGESARAMRGGLRAPDRRRLAAVAWRVACASYEEQTRETVAEWQNRIFADYSHRYARVKGLLVPGLLEQVTAARGVADDNLAWEIFDAARTYPWQQKTAPDLATARVEGDELDLGTRKVRFRRRFFRVKRRLTRVPVRERPTTDDPAEWLAGFAGGGGLCSYPPEDVVVEDYGRFLQKKAVSVLSAERQRSEPFSTSLLDGIDVRETLRHLAEGEVWVREQGRVPGDAGSVIVIFDPDEENGFPYLMTWLGEHDQESDMAFYSTHPAEQVVGPGIMRATYGGFLMTMPPGRLADVWTDPDYRSARSKPEVLLTAGIDYSEERYVAHVAARPPADRMRRYAAVQGKKIVHVPIGSLSPVSLERIRVLHVLVGHDKRAIAEDYVW